MQEAWELCRVLTTSSKYISRYFSPKDFASALQLLKSRKAPGPNSICPELIFYAVAALKSWSHKLPFFCMPQLKLPKIWRRALVVAISKPNKLSLDPKSYTPISLSCIPYKIVERLIYARIEPIIDSLLPRDQAGFRRQNSTILQVAFPTQKIEDSFTAQKKASALFVNLTAAYGITCLRGLTVSFCVYFRTGT